jgi:hypothetical protein
MALPTMGSYEVDAHTVMITVKGTLKQLCTEVASGSLANKLCHLGDLEAINKTIAMSHLVAETTNIYATWYIRPKAG